MCAIEVANINSLLTGLIFRLEESDSATGWYTAVRDLATNDGALNQFKAALEELQSGMVEGGRMKKLGEALVWKFKKEQVTSILARIERLKTLVQIALSDDHL
jgi:hypothetical protein